MQFRILNNTLIQFFRPGVALYNPSYYNEIAIYPISRISSIHLVERCVKVEFTIRVEKLCYETDEEAKQAFNKLIELMGGAEKPNVKNDGPNPDLWAMEQLK
jgi:hypothetical protein